MTWTDRFWDELVAQNLLDRDEADEAIRLQRKLGGAPDSAILEVRPLGTAEQLRLLRVLARAFDQPLAPPEFLERPELDALHFFPRELASRHGLLAIHVNPHRLVVVGPALGPHVLSELAFVVGRPVEAYLALELDIRRALRRHLDVPLGDRFTALDGRYPASGESPDTAALPALPPAPRSREIRIEPPSDSLTSTGRFRALGAIAPVGRMRSPLDTPPGEPRPEATPTDLTRLVRDLDDADGAVRADAEARLLAAGERGLEALLAVFPGPLRVDRYAVDATTVPIEEHGGVLRAVRQFGAGARGPLAALATALSPDVRYYAVALLGALGDPAGLVAVAERLFDKDASVRGAAARALEPAFEGAFRASTIDLLGRTLAADVPARRRAAAEALGRLRAEEAVPALVDALAHAADGVADAAHRALVELTRHDLGLEAGPWRRWYEQNRHRSRIEWLLDGLASEQRGARAGAFHELRRLTRLDLGFGVDAPPTERHAAVERWRRWWAADGREQFVAARRDSPLP